MQDKMFLNYSAQEVREAISASILLNSGSVFGIMRPDGSFKYSFRCATIKRFLTLEVRDIDKEEKASEVLIILNNKRAMIILLLMLLIAIVFTILSDSIGLFICPIIYGVICYLSDCSTISKMREYISNLKFVDMG